MLNSPINIVGTPVKKSHTAQSPLTALTAATQSLFSPYTAPASPFSSQKKLGDRRSKHSIHVVNESILSPERTEQVEHQICKIDEKIVSNHNYIENKLQGIEGLIKKADEAVAAEFLARELLEERATKEMKMVEANIDLDIEHCRELAVEGEIKILRKLESQIQGAREECLQNQHQIANFMDETSQAVTQKVERLALDVQEEVQAREQTHTHIIETIGGGLSRIQQTMDVERKIRRETEAFLFTKIEEVCKSLQTQVQTEKERRIRSEEQMLILLEEACGKYENHLLLHRRR